MNYAYALPANYESILADARVRAEKDSGFASVLRNIDSHYGPRYAQGVLSVIGLPDLGNDYAWAADMVRMHREFRDTALDAQDAMRAAIPADAQVERDIAGYPTATTPEAEAACAEFRAAEAKYDAIRLAVMAFAAAGMTPDYDGAPC